MTKILSTGAPWPGTTTGPLGEQSDHHVEGVGPLEREAVRAVRRGRGLLDEVAGQHHVAVRDAHHEVAAGVPAARVDELDHPVAEVHRRHAENRSVAVGTSASSWAWTGRSGRSAWKAPLPCMWSKCSWVLTTATTSPAAETTQVLTHRAHRLVGPEGVDDDQAALAVDDA